MKILASGYGRAAARRPRSSALFTECPTRRTFKFPELAKPHIQRWPQGGKRVLPSASKRGRRHGLWHVSVAAPVRCARCRTARQPHSAEPAPRNTPRRQCCICATERALSWTFGPFRGVNYVHLRPRGNHGPGGPTFLDVFAVFTKDVAFYVKSDTISRRSAPGPTKRSEKKSLFFC